MEIYEWEYSYANNKFEVQPNPPKEIPKSFFKYYALNRYSFDSIINQYIYAPHPSQLNDLFDCSMELFPIEDFSFLTEILSDFDFKNKSEIEKKLKQEYCITKKFAETYFWERLYRTWGVLSLTDTNDNVLMWSYYNQHRGLCIEFDIKKFSFDYHGPFPINYQLELRPMKFKRENIALQILLQCNLKNKRWKHENEWRIMVEKPQGTFMNSPNDIPQLRKLSGHDRKFPYPIEAIKSISLGNRFFENNEIKEQNRNGCIIKLQSNFEQKSIILDFISSNKILTHIGRKEGLNTISFTDSIIERINYKEYKINAC